MKIVYFDACTHDDYDKIVTYLLEKQYPMANRNKLAMSLAAKVPEDLPAKMLRDVTFEDTVSYGEEPLLEVDRVTEGTEWSTPEPQFAQ